jgi:hypothetical protein
MPLGCPEGALWCELACIDLVDDGILAPLRVLIGHTAAVGTGLHQAYPKTPVGW